MLREIENQRVREQLAAIADRLRRDRPRSVDKLRDAFAVIPGLYLS